MGPSAELSGAPKALVGGLAVEPNTLPLDPPPNILPPVAPPPPKDDLLFPPNKPPELLLVLVPPNPPSPPEPPAVAVVAPNIVLLEVGLLPNAGLLPPKVVADEGAPNPEAAGDIELARTPNIDVYAFCRGLMLKRD